MINVVWRRTSRECIETSTPRLLHARGTGHHRDRPHIAGRNREPPRHATRARYGRGLDLDVFHRASLGRERRGHMRRGEHRKRAPLCAATRPRGFDRAHRREGEPQCGFAAVPVVDPIQLRRAQWRRCVRRTRLRGEQLRNQVVALGHERDARVAFEDFLRLENVEHRL